MNHSGPSIRYRRPNREQPDHSCEQQVARKAATYLILFAAIPLSMMGGAMEKHVLEAPTPFGGTNEDE